MHIILKIILDPPEPSVSRLLARTSLGPCATRQGREPARRALPAAPNDAVLGADDNDWSKARGETKQQELIGMSSGRKGATAALLDSAGIQNVLASDVNSEV